MFFAIICTGANTFFSFRTPAPYISAMIIQVVVYPIGKFAAWALPIRTWTLPRWLGSVQFSFNPGPFNIKEHALIVIMANISLTPAYALYSVVTSELWYGHDFGIGFSILLMLSTQLTGFAFAGLCRRFVVWPASMIWPSVLAVSTSLNAFHAEDEGYEGGMTRIRFLMVCGGAAFAYYFLPGEWRLSFSDMRLNI
jgi:OPT family oligopeptide transporter